jgi:hypothetical protein
MCGPLNFSAAVPQTGRAFSHDGVRYAFRPSLGRNQARKWSSLGVNKFCLYLPHNENNIVPVHESSKGGKPFKKRRTLPKKTRHLMHIMSAAVCSMSCASFFRVPFIPPPHIQLFRKRIKTRTVLSETHDDAFHFLNDPLFNSAPLLSVRFFLSMTHFDNVVSFSILIS